MPNICKPSIYVLSQNTSLYKKLFKRTDANNGYEAQKKR